MATLPATEGPWQGYDVAGATVTCEVMMYVEERGLDTGAAIVFLHGSMVAGWMWAEQVAALSDAYHTIVPDLPGMGSSASEEWTSFAGVAESVADEIVRCAPDGAHVVGLSLGGIVALNLAASHPELCQSLLVSGVPSGSLSLPLRLLSTAMGAAYGTRFGSRAIGRLFGLSDAESMEAFVATALATDGSAIRAISSEVASRPLPDGLERINVPTLAVVGDKDTKPARRAVPWLAATMPNAKGAEVPGVGHQWNAEEPTLFSDMVRLWVAEQALHPSLVEVPGATTP